MAGESKTTTDHETIRRWVEERGGRPARVKETGSNGDPGILRIDYPGRGDFEAFEENNLAFLYQEETADGEESRFSKLVNR
jgi:hypothetical protein